jgi:TonB-dependent receptor
MSATLSDPSLWYEDVNYTAVQQHTGRYIMEEGVDAAYLQGQAKIGRLTFLAGVRGEWVNTEVFTYFARLTRTPIAVEPDHFKRAALDYARQSRDGEYHKYFPSYHLAYDLTKNLKLRSSWTTSYGRPRRQDIVPTPSISETARTVTVGNASLKPQMAKNIDLKLEYYFGNGMVSVRGYKKKITDYISTATRSGLLVGSGPENGFDGLYEGFEFIQSGNTGSATLRGLEFDFRKPLTFLPGILRGLTFRGNYTYLETYGRFAGTTDLKNGQVAGFIPKAANVGLIYYYRNFGANFDMNFTGRYPIGYSLTTPQSSNIYRDAWKTMNAGITYRIRPDATVFLNVNNIAQEGLRNYMFMESRTRTQYIMPRSLKFGINGQF